MAGAILLLSLSNSFTVNLHSYLFGSILTVHWHDIFVLIMLLYGVILLGIKYGKYILSAAIDPENANVQGIHVGLINYLSIVIISLVITASLLIGGILLASALLVIPVL